MLMKDLCLVTGFNKEYYNIAEITIPNFIEYSVKNNIDLHISTKNLYDKYNWGWNKYHIINDVLLSYKWILWVDIDCLFINKEKNIKSIIDENYSLILSENKNAPPWYTEDSSYIENGVFLLKNDLTGRAMLDHFMTDPIEHPWHDQYKMILTLRNNATFNQRTKRLQLYELNAIDEYQFKKEEIFIYHVAGGSSKTLTEKINLLKRHNEK